MVGEERVREGRGSKGEERRKGEISKAGGEGRRKKQ